MVVGGSTQSTDAKSAEGAAGSLLLAGVTRGYEGGWQPLDLVAFIRREVGSRASHLVSAAISEEARRANAADRAPADWLEQLDAISPAGSSSPELGWLVSTWRSNRGPSIWDGWHDTLTVIGLLQNMHVITRLVPPPSQWSASTANRSAPRPVAVRPDGSHGGHDPKMLTRIRALLTKAESTTFAEEADAYTSKAQDLITRYAIDEALLVDESHGFDVRSRRVHVENPYAAVKVQLLGAVANVNRVKAIWDDHHGFATITGLPVDLDLVDMLFTSLLIQATRAMTEAGATERGGHRLDRSPSFRRAFLMSYAGRIGERLAEAGDRAQHEAAASHGAELVPLLARQKAAVEQEFERLFPDSRPMGARRVDARGWHAGRAAADKAVFAAGQVGRS